MDGERRETIEELSDLLVVVQEMGRRLRQRSRTASRMTWCEELNEILHSARLKIGRSGRRESPSEYLASSRPQIETSRE